MQALVLKIKVIAKLARQHQLKPALTALAQRDLTRKFG